jgi:CMP/dCMP kinase
MELLDTNITVSGAARSGKGHNIEFLAKDLGYTPMSMGDLKRLEAVRLGISQDEYNRRSRDDPVRFDKAFDESFRQFGAAHRKYIFDARIAFHFIESIKVYLKVDPIEAAKRALGNPRPSDDLSGTLEDIAARFTKRNEDDRLRFLDLYGVDFMDENHYDIVLDTTKITPINGPRVLLDKIVPYLQGKISIKPYRIVSEAIA